MTSFPGLFGISVGSSAYDPSGRAYMFDLAGRLYSVDVQTGAVIGNPVLAHSISASQFDSIPEPSTAILLGCGLLALAYCRTVRRQSL